MDESADDLVLQILSATDQALSTEEICSRLGPGRTAKDVRVVLRDLAQKGDVSRLGPDTWRGVVVPEAVHAPAAEEPRFTDDELVRARARHGSTTSCPHCRKVGDIDTRFGWRRLHREDSDIVPQSWCFDCRFAPKAK